MRLFFATFLSRETMRSYQTLIDQLIEDVPGTLRTIPRHSHHFTLVFLGEIADADVDKCASALQAVERIEPFSISLSQPRILKGRGRPRLICADINDGREKVSVVEATLIAHLSKSLPALDLRPKPPHVTLARFERNARAQQARKVDEATARHYDTDHSWEDRFTSVRLVKSSLTKSGPIYKTVAESYLGVS